MVNQIGCASFKKIFSSFFVASLFYLIIVVPCNAGQQIAGWGRHLMPNVPLTERPMRIAPGAYRTFAIVSPGTIVCWGDNKNGWDLFLGNTIANAEGTPPGGNTFRAVVAALEHAVALRADGSLVSWGDNGFNQVSGTPLLEIGNPFTAIAAVYAHSLALKADGSVVAWGDNTYGQCTVPADLFPCQAISCGTRHSLALSLYGGAIRGWGSDFDDTTPIPVYCGQASPPPGLPNYGYRAITSGLYFNVAIRSDGNLVAWGRNESGQTTVPAGNNYIAVAAGIDHCVALRSDGSIAAWGNNFWGEATAPAGNDFVAIAAGGFTSVAIRTDGSFVVFGNNVSNQGMPFIGNNFSAVSAGGYVAIALKSDGSLMTSGFTPPMNPPAGNNYIAVSTGNKHAIALKSNRTIAAWGDTANANGAAEPPIVPGDTTFIAISASCTSKPFNLAIKSDGSLYGWGWNDANQISPLPSGNNFIAVAAGAKHGLALRSNGMLAAWGKNDANQVSPLPGGNDFIAITAGAYHNVALRSNGSIVSWGKDDAGQVSASPSGNDFIAIAAGVKHSVALRSDGSLVVWGSDEFGQITSRPTGNNFTAISANWDYTVALRAADCSQALSGDFNNDCTVDFRDMKILAQNWLATNCIGQLWCGGADTNRNGTVNFRDFAALAQNWFLFAPK
ncbi:MAG: dockerin type I domain-containing protein [Sedimentisphaerales bacterium]